MIKVSEVTKHFENFKALNSMCLHVPKGTIYGLIGPNGAGKTTIINHINGCLKQENGLVTVAGENVYENEKIKQKILSISDDWFYFGTYTIKQMAMFYKDIYTDFNTERYEKLKEVFKLNEKKQIRKLSKGQKKQVAFWLSLSAMPMVLILDEPLDGLDPVMRKQVLNLVISDVADRELTVLVSSHNLRELEDICDHVGIMSHGKMIIQRRLDDLKTETHKIQVAFSDSKFPEELSKKFNLLKVSQLGTVFSTILKGDKDEIIKEYKKFNPVILDIIPLTLEEIFIYEVGGESDEIKEAIS